MSAGVDLGVSVINPVSGEEVETLVKVCCANFNAGEETIKMVLREQWQKKKAKREAAAGVDYP